jgi:hypothetical protein
VKKGNRKRRDEFCDNPPPSLGRFVFIPHVDDEVLLPSAASDSLTASAGIPTHDPNRPLCRLGHGRGRRPTAAVFCRGSKVPSEIRLSEAAASAEVGAEYTSADAASEPRSQGPPDLLVEAGPDQVRPDKEAVCRLQHRVRPAQRAQDHVQGRKGGADPHAAPGLHDAPGGAPGLHDDETKAAADQAAAAAASGLHVQYKRLSVSYDAAAASPVYAEEGCEEAVRGRRRQRVRRRGHVCHDDDDE